MTEEEEPNKKRVAGEALPRDNEKKIKLEHHNDIDAQTASSVDSEDDTEEELTPWERHERKIDKIRATRKEYKDALFFPCVAEEEMDGALISISYDVARWRRGDDNNDSSDDDDDINRETHFTCDICDVALENSLRMGQCDLCQKTLGLCCYYESQWLDNLERDDIVKAVKPDDLLVCPSCVDALYHDIVTR